MEDRYQQIHAFVESQRESMLKDLETAVNINSFSDNVPGTEKMGDFFAAKLEALDFKVKRLPGGKYGSHVYGEYEAVPGAPWILFYGHMDTVFAPELARPFEIDGSRAHGAGVIDMKSGILILLYALKGLKENGGIPMNVKVLFNSDEEPGSPSSMPLIPTFIDNVAYAGIMEPAEPDGSIITFRKGIGRFYFDIKGRSAHAGKQPETGLNANLELAKLIVDAEKVADLSKGTTITTGLMQGGISAYVVPEHASAEVDARVCTNEEQERVCRDMFALRSDQYVPGTVVSITGGFHRPPMVELPGAAKLRECLSISSEKTGVAIKFGMSGAASDGNSIVPFGIPVIDGLGGVGGREHSSDEYIELESYYQKTELIAGFLMELAVK